MNTIAATRWVLRLGVPVLAFTVLYAWWTFGVMRVQQGMETMPDTHPPGALCLVQKRPSAAVEGSVVFLALPDGSTVLTRILQVRADGTFDIRHDNRKSGFVWLETRGPYELEDVRGVVVSMLAAEPQDPPAWDK